MGKTKPRLIFYFLHLLGVGHIHRAKRLIEGFAAEGIAVDIIYGGHDVGEKFQAETIHYLPPIAAKDATYKDYVDEAGNPLTPDYLAQRQTSLLDHLETLSPDGVLIEAWPFGRRIVADEIKAMLDACAIREIPPRVITSVRDILQPRKAGRAEETLSLIQSRVDDVLVHSDPALIGLHATYPLANEIEHITTYTGFVVPPVALDSDVKKFDIIATCGGGGFGFDMLKTALTCAHSGSLSGKSWCIATGPHMNDEDIEILRKTAPENVTIVSRLENLAAHLVHAELSISQCGYNTAMDVLAAQQAGDCRAVFIPYDTQEQVEQLRRAELLAEAELAICLPQSSLDETALSDAINAALSLSKITTDTNFQGVENSARLIRSWLGERP